MAQLVVEPDTANLDLSRSRPRVITGSRAYFPYGWTRKDSIWFQGQRIGKIVLAHDNRTGITFALNGRQHPGRALDWCLQQFLAGSQTQHRRSLRFSLSHLPFKGKHYVENSTTQ